MAVWQRVGLGEHVAYFVDGLPVALLDDGAQTRFLCCWQLALCANQRQGGFAFGKVVAQRFANGLRIAHVIEQVVHDLKGHAELFAIFGKRLHFLRIHARIERRAFAAGGKEHGGFQFDHAVIACFVDVGIVHIAKLHDFAGGNLVGGIGHDLQHFGIAGAYHELKGTGIKKIADQYAGGIAKSDIGGRLAAPHRRFVHHVIMQEGGAVDEFDKSGSSDVVLPPVAACARREENEQRTVTFALAAQRVCHDHFRQRHFAVDFVPHQLFGALHFVAHQCLNFRECHDGRCSAVSLMEDGIVTDCPPHRLFFAHAVQAVFLIKNDDRKRFSSVKNFYSRFPKKLYAILGKPRPARACGAQEQGCFYWVFSSR